MSHGFSREALDETVAYLRSDEAIASIEVDSYWPKWDGPWWRVMLLFELGLVSVVPERVVEALVQALATRYLTFFPFRIEDVPPGIDPIRNIPCHCQLGTIYTALVARGVDVDSAVPWLRPWFVRYQLPDGGLNCDEAAYLRPVPRSSVVSTLPALEAILVAKPPHSPAEVAFLDAGARYLIERRLHRSVSKGGATIDPSWLRPCFPRFYDYDVLRGLHWLVRHALAFERTIPASAIEESLAALEPLARGESLVIGRRACAEARTRFLDVDGEWKKRDARRFALLDEVSAPGRPSPELGRVFAEVRAGLRSITK